MYKLVVLIIFVISLGSCSTRRNYYNAITSTLNSIKTPFNSRIIDTLEIINHTFPLDSKILEGYKLQKEIILNKKLKSSNSFFEWVDKKYNWILSDADIEFMKKSSINEKNCQLKLHKFKNLKKDIIILQNPTFKNFSENNIELEKRIKIDKFIYQISNPIYNKQKNIFMIQYKTLFLNSTSTLIFIKEDKIWKQIALLYPDVE